MRHRILHSLIIVGVAAGVAFGAVASAADPLTRAVDVTSKTDASARQSQRRIDALDDQTQKMLDEYRTAIWQTQQLTAYADGLQPLINQQTQQINQLKDQLASGGDLGKKIQPLLLQMVDSLARFVKLDLPFLQSERENRIANLRQALTDPSLSLAQKFRRITQAYQVEIGYGRHLGAERLDIKVNGVKKSVDVLHVGRVILLYETLDGSGTGYWSPQKKAWVSLGDRYASGITEGLKIARQESPDTTLVLPLPTPEQGS